MNNSTEDNNDHPLELTVKDSQRSNQMVRIAKIVHWLRMSNRLGSILPLCILSIFHLDPKW